jgi:hypothetical protein
LCVRFGPRLCPLNQPHSHIATWRLGTHSGAEGPLKGKVRFLIAAFELVDSLPLATVLHASTSTR